MKRAVVYCRVSTREQVENMSLPTQQKACREYCETRNISVDRVFVEEGESAKSVDRTELQNLLAYCSDHRQLIDFVVVFKVDRFSRYCADHQALRVILHRYGILLRSVTEPIDETAEGTLMENVLSAVAQYDNQSKARRTVQGMKAALESGRWTFQPPLGYLSSKKASGAPCIVEDPDRGPLIREAFETMARGDKPMREVLRLVTAKGLSTRRGNSVSPQTFGTILRNKLYYGIIDVPDWGIHAVGDFIPLVTEDVFTAVQRVLDGKQGHHNPRERFHPDFPLRRFVKCAECGTPLTASWSTGRTKRYGYYRCPNGDCRAVNARKEALEAVFIELLDHFHPRPDYFNLFTEIVVDVWNRRNRDMQRRRVELNSALKELAAKRNSLVDAFIYESKIDQQTYDEQGRRLDERRRTIELELSETATDSLDVEATLDFARHAFLNARPLWVELDHVRKRRFQEVLFPNGVRFDGDTIGTATTSSLFSYLSEISEEKEEMVTPTGFEPVLPA